MNANYMNILKKTWNKTAFKQLSAEVHGGIGTHFICKLASTWCAEHGMSPTEVEIHGQLKGGHNGRVVNLYINIKQLPMDGKVAASLCVGQLVKYKLKPDTSITRAWLLTNVVPVIHEHFTDGAANRIVDVLAVPLLGTCWQYHCCGHAWILWQSLFFHLH